MKKANKTRMPHISYSMATWLMNTAILISSLLIIAAVLESNYKRIAINAATSLNNEFSKYVDHISSQIQKTIQHYALQTFYMPAVTTLRTSNEITNYEQILGIRALATCVSSSNLIHSVYVYNSDNQYVYTTLECGSYQLNELPDSGAVELLSQHTNNRRWQPIPRKITTHDGKYITDVYSFLIYESADNLHFDNAMMINVNADTYNDDFFYADKGTPDEMLLLDKHGRLIAASSAYKREFLEQDLNILSGDIGKSKTDGYVVSSVRNEKTIYFYSHMPTADWYFVRVRSYRNCMNGLAEVQQQSLIIVLILTLMGAIATLITMMRFYLPLRKVAGALAPKSKTDQLPETDIVLNLDFWVKDHANEKEAYLSMLKSEFLKQLLTSPVPADKSIADKNIAQNFIKYEISFSPTAPLYLIAFRDIAPAQALSAIHDISPSIRTESVQIGKNVIVLIQPATPAQLFTVCNAIISLGTNFCGYSLPISHLNELHRTYSHLCELTSMRIFYSDTPILSEEIITERCKENSYMDKLENRLICALKAGRSDDIATCYTEFTQITRHYRYNVILFHFKRLYLAIYSLYMQYHLNDTAPLEAPDADFIEALFSSADSFEEISDFFFELFGKITSSVQASRNEECSLIMEQVKRLILSEYKNYNLSPSWLAEQLNLSLVQLSKIFRMSEQGGINEYINAVRIEKAKELLKNSNLTIKEITAQVGIENNQYFYTLFKNCTGLTPAAYRQLMHFQNSSPQEKHED
ncbi:MAG: helix-turn-helix domain-containing protein [Oscillospiraceae bacterium]